MGLHYGLAAEFVDDRAEPLGNRAKRFVPANRLEFCAALVAGSTKRGAETYRGIAPRAIVGDGAFSA